MSQDVEHNKLIEIRSSVLVVVDAQQYFYDKLPKQHAEQLIKNACWLIKVAGYIGVPFLVTAEEHDQQPLAPAIEQALPDRTKIHQKVTFGLADQRDIMRAYRNFGRTTAILIGLETDVCIMHSALGLLQRGCRVVIVADAVGTPEPNQQLALERMRNAGAIISNTKGVFYEWLRTIDAVNQFHAAHPEMRGQIDIEL